MKRTFALTVLFLFPVLAEDKPKDVPKLDDKERIEFLAATARSAEFLRQMTELQQKFNFFNQALSGNNKIIDDLRYKIAEKYKGYVVNYEGNLVTGTLPPREGKK